MHFTSVGIVLEDNSLVYFLECGRGGGGGAENSWNAFYQFGQVVF